MLGIGHRIGAIRRHDSSASSRSDAERGDGRASSVGDSVVAMTSMPKRSNSARGRNAGVARALADVIEVAIGGFLIERHVEAEYARENIVQPERRRRTVEEMEVPSKSAPRLDAGSMPDALPLAATPSCSERNALAVEHPEQIVIGREQQTGRVPERFIRERTTPDRCARADSRSADRAHPACRRRAIARTAGSAGKKPVFVQFEPTSHDS